MRKKWTVNIMILTALAVLYLAMGTAVYAETTGDLTETISYVLNDEGTLTISGTGEMPDYKYTNDNWSPFRQNSSIKKAVIGEGITNIGNYLLYGCGGLEQVSLPASVTEIGDYAFNECSNLKAVSFPDGIKSIGEGAYANCNSLTSITIPDSVTEIGHYVFHSCWNLKSVKLSANLKKIPSQAFDNSLILSVALPDGIEEIGAMAFDYCPNLREITIPAKVKSIGEYAFVECYSLDTVTFKGNSPAFGEGVFCMDDITAYYPLNNKTWMQDIFKLPFCGKIKWVGVCSHNAGASVTENRKEATVFAAGSYDTVVRCKNCGQQMSRKTTTIAKLKPTIKLSAKKKTLKKKKTYTLKVTGLAKGDSVKSYKSSKKGVASVTKKGKIRAIKKGKAVITVTLKSGKTAKCKITVK